MRQTAKNTDPVERLGIDADRLRLALAAQILSAVARASASSTVRSRSASARILADASAPSARACAAMRCRSDCMRDRIAWVFSCGRSARRMRTSSIDAERLASRAFTWSRMLPHDRVARCADSTSSS